MRVYDQRIVNKWYTFDHEDEKGLHEHIFVIETNNATRQEKLFQMINRGSNTSQRKRVNMSEKEGKIEDGFMQGFIEALFTFNGKPGKELGCCDKDFIY